MHTLVGVIMGSASGWETMQHSAQILTDLDISHEVRVVSAVLALELFQVGGTLIANEIAPRVHNSGHWTIEGAETSQFENHLRAILGLPLGSTAARGHAAMVNFIGELPEMTQLLAIPSAHLHRYGKAPRPGRKLGHATVLAMPEVWKFVPSSFCVYPKRRRTTRRKNSTRCEFQVFLFLRDLPTRPLQRCRLLDEPLGQRLGQCGDGELLLLAQDQTDSAQNVSNTRRGQSRVFDYIERFYNPKRRHSTIGYLSPMEFERKAGLA